MLVLAIPFVILKFTLFRYNAGATILFIVLYYLLTFAIGLFYNLYFVGTRGATPGKKILNLRIIREDGIEPVGYGKAFLRLLGYILSGMIFYIGFIMIAFTDRKRGLHDMVAGTNVIKVG